MIAHRSNAAGLLSVVALALAVESVGHAMDEAEPRRLRHPVALAVDETHVWVANRAGTLAVVDHRDSVVKHELPVGDRLSALARTADGRALLVTDEARHELVVVSARLPPKIVQRLAVPSFPVSVVVAGPRVSVASLWSRRLAVFDQVADRWPPPRVIDLPFAPRSQWLAPDGSRLVVADAFGGRVAVVDPATAQIVAHRTVPGHHLRGLTSIEDGTRLFFVQQLLNAHVPTTRDRVFWGSVLANVARSVALTDLLAPGGDAGTPDDIAHWRLYPLGEAKNGAGDPHDLAVLRDGRVLVTYAGVDQVAVFPTLHDLPQRLSVGRRPTAIAVSPDERTAYIAESFDDRLAVLDLRTVARASSPRELPSKTTVAGSPSHDLIGRIALGPLPELTRVEEGERLFYDARLSLDGWYSCHSCHTDGHTNGQLNDNFGDDSFGAPKRVLSLHGAAHTGPWGWTGRKMRLDEQVRQSIAQTMQGEKHATPTTVAALTAFLETLVPPPSLAEARGLRPTEAWQRGKRLFRHHCAECHAGEHLTSAATFDVGLADEVGGREFNPPSLRGLSQRDAFFHDNRARSLREVLDRFRHPGRTWTPAEQEALLEYLRSR